MPHVHHPLHERCASIAGSAGVHPERIELKVEQLSKIRHDLRKRKTIVRGTSEGFKQSSYLILIDDWRRILGLIIIELDSGNELDHEKAKRRNNQWVPMHFKDLRFVA